jgi:hypothetical protein
MGWDVEADETRKLRSTRNEFAVGRLRQNGDDKMVHHGVWRGKAVDEAAPARNITRTYLDTMSSSAIRRCCEGALGSEEKEIESRCSGVELLGRAPHGGQCGSADFWLAGLRVCADCCPQPAHRDSDLGFIGGECTRKVGPRSWGFPPPNFQFQTQVVFLPLPPLRSS